MKLKNPISSFKIALDSFMTMSSSLNIRKLPLHDRHAALGGKFGNFGDWEVPLYFAGILEEHDAVRSRAGLFDISHMGKFYFEGAGTAAFLNSFLPRNIQTMESGKALYMPLLNDQGGFVDDIIVYKVNDARFIIIVNASNTDKDDAWIRSRTPQGVEFTNASAEKGLIAIQGPLSVKLLEKVLGTSEFSSLGYYRFKEWKDGMIARTGYTGEDGFEIMAGFDILGKLWDGLLAAGKDQGVMPIGFGARDTLRLEAGMPLYGHDMDDKISPIEAGLDWAIDWTKEKFTARDILLKQKQQGAAKKLVGFEMVERGIPRQDYNIQKNGKNTGVVTSGTFSPTLKKNIGMGYVEIENSKPGTEIEIVVRDKAIKANVVKLPFYKRSR